MPTTSSNFCSSLRVIFQLIILSIGIYNKKKTILLHASIWQCTSASTTTMVIRASQQQPVYEPQGLYACFRLYTSHTPTSLSLMKLDTTAFHSRLMRNIPSILVRLKAMHGQVTFPSSISHRSCPDFNPNICCKNNYRNLVTKYLYLISTNMVREGMKTVIYCWSLYLCISKACSLSPLVSRIWITEANVIR